MVAVVVVGIAEGYCPGPEVLHLVALVVKISNTSFWDEGDSSILIKLNALINESMG